LGAVGAGNRALSLAETEAALSEIGRLFGIAQRRYFVESAIHGNRMADLKKSLTNELGLTDRQFTSVRLVVDGKVESLRKTIALHRDGLKHRIGAAAKTITALEKKLERSLSRDAKHRDWRGRSKTALAAGQKEPRRPKALEFYYPDDAAVVRQSLRFVIHQKKRRLEQLKQGLHTVEKRLAAGKVPLCFGGGALFAAQKHLAENGFDSRAEWKMAWQESRSSSIFCVGSSDETMGNQTATLLPGNTLRLRVPPALEGKFGRYLWLSLKTVRRGQAEIEQNCLAGGGKISWRLVRKTVQRGTFWFAQATIDQAAPEEIPDARIGAWGIDLNADHVAATRMDRFGNPVETTTFGFSTTDQSSEQIKARLGDISAELVALAVRDGVALVSERLDFSEKKAALRERSKGYARMLSSFIYSRFAEILDRRAEAHGITLKRLNPAFTSVIGRYKFAEGYNLSLHHAAALAIARRAYGFTERVVRCEPRQRACKPVLQVEGEASASITARPLPVRTRGRHVWSDWRRLATMLRADRLNAAKARGGETGTRASRRPRRYGVNHKVHVTRALRPSVRRPQRSFPAAPAVRAADTVHRAAP
jgi:IS605 OrfB family transposase